MNTKTLRTIQVLSKIGKILSKIVFVCSIVGAVLCTLGVLGFSLGVTSAVKFGNITLKSILDGTESKSVGTVYCAIITAFITFVGQIFLSNVAVSYFKNELTVGTPFTFEGAKELLKLGICTIAIPLGTNIVSSTIYGIMKIFFDNIGEISLDNSISVGLGIMMIICSVLCKYGAEISTAIKGSNND